MDEEKKKSPYEDFQDVVDQYGEGKGHDLLTDPDALARAHRKVEKEQALDHGAKVRASRQERGFTLEELAEKTGIDRDELALVEEGKLFLPLGQVIRLSKVLSLSMADVISTGQEPFTIVRAHERQAVQRFGKTRQTSHGYEYESLAPGKRDRKMEPFIITLEPAVSDEPSTHEGQEFIYVLEGEMRVVVGDVREVLGPGDAVYYDAATSHFVGAHGDKPAKILAVIIS